MKIHPKRIVHFLQNRFQIFFESTILYDVIEIRRIFYKEVGYRCHLFFPRSFNEKINWYKLHDTNPFYADLIDKIKVKEIVGKIIGEEYVIPTLFGGFKSVAEVPWGELSFPCVVKCNHDSGSTIVLTDRGGVNLAIKKLNQCMSHTPNQSPARARICGLIKPAILVEESIVPKENLNYDLLDYKFFCFNGKVKVFKIDRGRSKGKHSANYYSKEGEIIPIVEDCCPTKFDYVDEMPANLNEMIDIAEKLAQFVHRAFIRVDLYNVEGKIYFGELTFYPAAGYGSFTPQEWDFKLGEWIDLHKQW